MKNLRPPTKMENARHEAAHAVVAVRCGLPLLSTDIKRRTGQRFHDPSRTAANVDSLGLTQLDKGFELAWDQAWKKGGVDLTELLRCSAVYGAAGVIADLEMGLQLGHPGHADDLFGIDRYARKAGCLTPQEVAAYRDSAMEAARELLMNCDTGAAWDRVRVALLRKEALSGKEVEQMVGDVVRWPSVGLPPGCWRARARPR